MLPSIPRTFYVSYNNLTGRIPTALSGFGSESFDYNCFSDCSLIPQPWCSQPTSAGQISALVDLYDSTGGPQWNVSTNWTIGDPCSNRWCKVQCVLGGGPGCGSSNVTYVLFSEPKTVIVYRYAWLIVCTAVCKTELSTFPTTS